MDSLRAGLAAALRELRQDRALSQERLATAAGLHRSFVHRLERGTVNVSLDALQQLAGALEVPVSRLLALAEELGSREE